MTALPDHRPSHLALSPFFLLLPCQANLVAGLSSADFARILNSRNPIWLEMQAGGAAESESDAGVDSEVDSDSESEMRLDAEAEVEAEKPSGHPTGGHTAGASGGSAGASGGSAGASGGSAGASGGSAGASGGSAGASGGSAGASGGSAGASGGSAGKAGKQTAGRPGVPVIIQPKYQITSYLAPEQPQIHFPSLEDRVCFVFYRLFLYRYGFNKNTAAALTAQFDQSPSAFCKYKAPSTTWKLAIDAYHQIMATQDQAFVNQHVSKQASSIAQQLQCGSWSVEHAPTDRVAPHSDSIR